MFSRMFIITMVIFSTLFAEDINVLSYYAADNSIDGQPMLDRTNILRFFPVFNMRDKIQEVKICVFTDACDDYTADAVNFNGGQYWQVRLPSFALDNAIQRIECKVKFELDSLYKEKFYLLKQQKQNLDILSKKNDDKIKNNITVYESIQTKYDNDIKELNKNYSNEIASIRTSYASKKEITDFLDNIISKLDQQDTVFIKKENNGIINDIKQNDILKSSIIDMIINEKSIVAKYPEALNNIQSSYKEEIIKEILKISEVNLKTYKSQFDELVKDNDSIKIKTNQLRKDIIKEMFADLSDTTRVGPKIEPFDLIIDDNYLSATLLYRYYKNNLRYRKALDPAEKLGIFRLRYVPFPVTVLNSENSGTNTHLIRPFEKGSPTVFEIGLAFGDKVISGDYTLNPSFSWSRFGVAIVLTEKLFTSEAEILGLALTYDFNTYGSIGFGVNLANNRNSPYFSFGINKKAFEDLMKNINKAFQ